MEKLCAPCELSKSHIEYKTLSKFGIMFILIVWLDSGLTYVQNFVQISVFQLKVII